jgi:hypothetical protein
MVGRNYGTSVAFSDAGGPLPAATAADDPLAESWPVVAPGRWPYFKRENDKQYRSPFNGIA